MAYLNCLQALFTIVWGIAESSNVVPLGVTVGITPYSHPVTSLYHSQDVYGQYVYGYSTPLSSKAESKTADGVTRGGYSYIDSNGILQTVQYTADAINGFRVAATNLPRDLPEVAYAKARHFADVAATRANLAVAYSNPIVVPAAQVPVLPQPVQDLPEVAAARAQHLATVNAAYAAAATASAPVPVQDTPEVARARAEHLAAFEQTKARDAAIALSPVQLTGNVVPVQTTSVGTAQLSYTPAVSFATSSQYHAQDELGQYTYGYVEPFSSKSETRSADGVTRGGYSYIDANGILQTVSYIADAVNGFRVAATNLPKAQLTAPVLQAQVIAAPAVVQKAVVAPNVVSPAAALYTHDIVY